MKGFVVSKTEDDDDLAEVFAVRFLGEPPKVLPRETLLRPDITEGVKGVLATSERARCLVGVFGCI
jgi:hypothetical protein